LQGGLPGYLIKKRHRTEVVVGVNINTQGRPTVTPAIFVEAVHSSKTSSVEDNI